VADDGAADFLGDRETDAQRIVTVVAWTHEQDEAGHGKSFAALGGKQIGTLGKVVYALSFLRPRARRAFRILRPPTVAERWRKPCRRLRTRLLGWKVRFIAHASNIRKKSRQWAAVVGGADSAQGVQSQSPQPFGWTLTPGSTGGAGSSASTALSWRLSAGGGQPISARSLRIASRRFALLRLMPQSAQRPALGCQRLNFT